MPIASTPKVEKAEKVEKVTYIRSFKQVLDIADTKEQLLDLLKTVDPKEIDKEALKKFIDEH